MRIAIVSFVDGCRRTGEKDSPDALRLQRRLADWFDKEGHEVVKCPDTVLDIASLRRRVDCISASRADAVVFNFCVWTFPDLPVQLANALRKPLLLVGNVSPSYPGWGAYLAAIGALEEAGIPFSKVLGDIEEPAVQAGVRAFVANSSPAGRLKGTALGRRLSGMRYGEFDGPAMGTYTGHIDQSQWMRDFGIHVYRLSQLPVHKRASAIGADRVAAGLDWLQDHARCVEWNRDSLTPGLDGTLARKLRLYLALKDICNEEALDFCGLTGRLDVSEDPERGCTADLAEAFLNDLGDFEQPRKRVVPCATECDSNGALTMMMLHLSCGAPVLFADLLHYHRDLGVLDLANSGQHVPYLAARSLEIRENWAQIALCAANASRHPGGGASLRFHAAPASDVTYARLVRKSGRHIMFLFKGEFVNMDSAEMDRLARQTTFEWPHVWAKFHCDIDRFVRQFSCNHIHAAVGNFMPEMIGACEHLGIEVQILD